MRKIPFFIIAASVFLFIAQAIMAQSGSLIVYYDFENVQGDKISDKSGHGV